MMLNFSWWSIAGASSGVVTLKQPIARVGKNIELEASCIAFYSSLMLLCILDIRGR